MFYNFSTPGEMNLGPVTLRCLCINCFAPIQMLALGEKSSVGTSPCLSDRSGIEKIRRNLLMNGAFVLRANKP
ncbi:hypothetical protein PVAP13_4NG302700 [Panicum virgatum]|uniref:Uncharacterized protein n=1 Tax=Panicum virgatum TaxID=38727 RepID=A0A8T0TCH3_PANVG|nr:hypothetical protein PVAP13_4NG302700 [Panicum virgatum]